MFQGEHYEFGPYLSPVYAPVLWGDSPHAWFGPRPPWWPGFMPFSPAMLDPAVPRQLPLHLLLLPRGLLQGVLGRSAVVLGRRAAQGLPRRELVSADPAEHSPLLPLHRARLHRPVVLGRLAGTVVREPGHRPERVRHRRRHAGAGGQRRAAGQLHLRLPRLAPPGRRLQGRGLEVAGVRPGLRLQHRAQLQAPAVRVVQPVLGRRSATSTSGCARWASGPT